MTLSFSIQNVAIKYMFKSKRLFFEGNGLFWWYWDIYLENTFQNYA